MGKRHEAIGIKQVTRMEWYDYALNLILDGQNPNAIRTRLDEIIRERLQVGGYGERGEQTYTKAVTQVMKCWVSPDRDLIPFRDDALLYARRANFDMRPALHWAVTIAAYPFWHRVASQIGRLLSLQDSITQSQIRLRCFEAMGERSTVERSARRVIRTLVSWGLLKDSSVKGCYERAERVSVVDPDLAVLMLEAVLHAAADGRGAIGLLLNSPGLFPFQLPPMTGDLVSRRSERIEVVRYGLDDELLMLKGGGPRKGGAG